MLPSPACQIQDGSSLDCTRAPSLLISSGEAAGATMYSATGRPGASVSTALAIALAVIADASDPTVRSVSDLTDIMEAMPVGTIPVMFNRDDRRHFKLVWGSLTAGFVAAAVIVAATVVSNH